MNSWKSVIFAVCVINLRLTSVANAQIFPPDAIVEGKTIAEWVGENQNWEWWLIDNEISGFQTRATHPADLASINNDGPVYLTGGFYGPFDPEPIVENLLVPTGRPIIKRAYDFSWDTSPQPLDANGLPPDVTGDPETGFGIPDTQQLLAAISTIVDSESDSVYLEIDGHVFTREELNVHRVQYEQIVTIGRNDFEIPPGDYTQVGDGFWFVLEPFEPGEQHMIRTGGIDVDGTVFPDITLNFIAVPEPSSCGLLAIAGLMLPLLRRRQQQHAP